MTHLFSLSSHNTLITGIISFWYLLCGWQLRTLGNCAHDAKCIIINTILFDNFSIISLVITLFSYHNGPFKSIFFCLRRHIGRAPVLMAESPNNMCYHSCPCSDTKCISGHGTLISHSACLLCKQRTVRFVFVSVFCLHSLWLMTKQPSQFLQY